MTSSEAFCLPNIAPKHSHRAGVVSAQKFEEVEAALLESRDRILLALEHELAEVRLLKNQARFGSLTPRESSAGLPCETVSDIFPHAALPAPPVLPANVVPFGREIFTAKEQLPPEAMLDPELERATVEELNAALHAAFSHVTEL